MTPPNTHALDALRPIRALCKAVDDHLDQWGGADKRPLYRALLDAEEAIAALAPSRADTPCRCGKPDDVTWWHGKYRCGQKSPEPSRADTAVPDPSTWKMAATGPFVDRICSIFSDRKYDDAVALVLHDYVTACAFATPYAAAPTPEAPDVEANHVERLLALRNEGGELFIMPEDVEALDVAIDALAAKDADEDAYVIEKLGRLLAEISITLNGPNLPNGLWSYHDLPAKVEALAVESRQCADEMDAWSEKRLSGPHDNRNVRRLLGGWAERLRAPTPTPEAPSGSHCATCTCSPHMTPAVRFDTSPAAKEGAIRDHLIAMGWTPPGATPSGSQAGEVEPDQFNGDTPHLVKCIDALLSIDKRGALVPHGIGGQARALLAAAARRLTTPTPADSGVQDDDWRASCGACPVPAGCRAGKCRYGLDNGPWPAAKPESA